MKKLHIINAKNLDNLDKKHRTKVLPLLERETLAWAKKMKKSAHKATLEVQKELKKNPDDKIRSKYFKYLRKLLMMKLEAMEEHAFKNNEDSPDLNSELVSFLDIQSLRTPAHISCSSINMYEFCPRKWFYRYALGIKFPKTAALHFGSAVDEALNYYFEEKIKGNKASLDQITKVYLEEFNKDRDEVNWGDDDANLLERNGPVIIEKYLEEFDRVTNPTDVQTEVRVPLDNGGLLLGYIDILEENAVVDTKTAKKKWKATGRYAKHLSELQPKAYSLWFLQEFERMPTQFRYQIVTKKTDSEGNATPEAQMVDFSLKKFELEGFRRRIQAVWDDIQKQLYAKDAKGNIIGMDMFPAQAEWGPAVGRGPGKVQVGVLCTREWCDYWQLCQNSGLDIPIKWVSKTKDAPGHHLYADGRKG